MNFTRTSATCLLLASLATGCYTVTPVPPQEAPAPAPASPAKVMIQEKIVETRSPSETDQLLAYYAATANLPREQAAKEVERARRHYETTGGAFSRMQLVLARLTLQGDQKEHDKALELLQVQLSSKDDSHSELRAMAILLRQLLGDNRQLEGNLEVQREKLKEETKKSDALRQKLDALLEAERKLQERNRPK